MEKHEKSITKLELFARIRFSKIEMSTVYNKMQSFDMVEIKALLTLSRIYERNNLCRHGRRLCLGTCRSVSIYIQLKQKLNGIELVCAPSFVGSTS